MLLQKKRPVFINLLKIKLPVAGVMSIAHRLAGVLLYLLLPFGLYLLELSLQGEEGFVRARGCLDGNLTRLFLFLVAWALVHHFLAGIRYLLLDIDIGIEKPVYQYSARFVLLFSPVLTLLIFWWIS